MNSANFQFDLCGIKNPSNILVGYHMGCPDGVASAYILNVGLEKLGLSAKIVPIGHSGQRFTEHIEPGQTVFSLDISPSLEDVDALQLVQDVIILDHHPSEVETQAKLLEALPGKVTNLSDASGEHCGASLAHKFVMANVEGISFDEDVIHMIHKMDVFQHKMPAHLDSQFLSFKSFLIQDGERNVSVELVERMFADKANSMRIGKALSKPILDRTAKLFESVQVLAETADFRILFCYQGADCRPIDLFSYQELIDTKIDGKPTLFLTQDELPNKGIFNLGLRRAGDSLDLSKFAVYLKGCASSPFTGGGGHAFAGGVQSNVLVARDEILRCCVDVLNNCVNPARHLEDLFGSSSDSAHNSMSSQSSHFGPSPPRSSTQNSMSNQSSHLGSSPPSSLMSGSSIVGVVLWFGRIMQRLRQSSWWL